MSETQIETAAAIRPLPRRWLWLTALLLLVPALVGVAYVGLPVEPPRAETPAPPPPPPRLPVYASVEDLAAAEQKLKSLAEAHQALEQRLARAEAALETALDALTARKGRGGHGKSTTGSVK